LTWGLVGVVVDPMTVAERSDPEAQIRVFISYAHDSPVHQDTVRDLWVFLRSNGFDARLDLPVAERRVDWPVWMHHEVRDADFVLVIASPAYKRRAAPTRATSKRASPRPCGRRAC
jgi:SEFIR domain-containing protein